MSADPQDLMSRFPIPGLHFERGHGGLTRAVVNTGTCHGELYLHGAHVTAWQPFGRQPVLWMSSAAEFAPGRPIRGGVPICFPWFGPHPSDSSAPAHGTARITEWTISSARQLPDDGIELQLFTSLPPFRLSYQVQFTSQLYLALSVLLPAGGETTGEASVGASPGDQPVRFEEALHTYLRVQDIHQVRIEGLEATGYTDKVGATTNRPPDNAPIQFTAETDRVYQNTASDCILFDPLQSRKIIVSKTGSNSTVIWNPWIDKSVRMPDFGDHEWPGMLCIETANVGENAVVLHPGMSHTMTTRLTVAAEL